MAKSVNTILLVLAAVLLVPAASYAAGLGALTVRSSLGQPLDAEIEVVALRPGEDLQIRLASREAYGAAGVDLSPALLGARFAIERRDGKTVIRVRTTQPVNDPFLSVLVEVQLPTGRLSRQYTVLVDPVEFKVAAATAPAAPPIAAAPAPAVAPSIAAPAPSRALAQPAPAQPVAATPSPAPAPAAPAAAVAPPAPIAPAATPTAAPVVAVAPPPSPPIQPVEQAAPAVPAPQPIAAAPAPAPAQPIAVSPPAAASVPQVAAAPGPAVAPKQALVEPAPVQPTVVGAAPVEPPTQSAAAVTTPPPPVAAPVPVVAAPQALIPAPVAPAPVVSAPPALAAQTTAAATAAPLSAAPATRPTAAPTALAATAQAPARPAAPAASTAPTQPSADASDTYRIKRGDTLGAIARKWKPESVTQQQMLIGLYQTNRPVFIRDNINLIRAGATLFIPGREDVLAISAADAARQVRTHMAAFSRYRDTAVSARSGSERISQAQREVITRRVGVKRSTRAM